MYDTVHFLLTAESVEGGFSEEVVKKVYNALSNTVGGKHLITKEPCFYGNLGNWKIRMSESRLTVKGSLCKFIMGNQFDLMLPGDVNCGIAKLSEILGVPMEKAHIRRLDIARNIKTEYKPELYWPYLSKLGRFARLEQDNGLYFRTVMCELAFYDKIREMKRKKAVIPLRFRESRLLRYELRFKKDVAKQLNVASVTGATLMEESFYSRMEEEWEQRYYSIVKVRDGGGVPEDVSNPREFQKFLEYAGIQKLGGETKVRDLIDRGRKQGKWSPVQASRMRQHLKTLAKSPSLTTESPLMIELDNKVRAVANTDQNAA